MLDVYTVLFALLTAIVAVLYIVDAAKNHRIKWIFASLASILVGAAVVFMLHEAFNETAFFFSMSIAFLFSILPSYYAVRSRELLAFLAIAITEFFYAAYAYGPLLYPFIQMFAIGTTFGLFGRLGLGIFNLRKGAKEKEASRRVETRRDYIHVILGVVIVGLFLVLPFYYAIYATMALLILGYINNSIIETKMKNGRWYKALSSLERQDSLYGLGALYLAIGTTYIIGFIHNLHFVLIGMFALFFADPSATIVGVNTRGPKLPYNGKKSVYGTIAFFLVVAVLGYIYIGYYSVLFAAVLALAESITPIDDNVTIAVIMAVTYIVFLAMVQQLPF